MTDAPRGMVSVNPAKALAAAQAYQESLSRDFEAFKKEYHKKKPVQKRFLFWKWTEYRSDYDNDDFAMRYRLEEYMYNQDALVAEELANMALHAGANNEQLLVGDQLLNIINRFGDSDE